MRKYETIIVIDSLLKSEEIESIISKYERFLSANGGQIESIERWGKRRLAYEIKKRQYGFYVLIRFDGPPAMIKQLEREYRLNESLLRYATIKLDKRALKVLEKQKSSLPVAPSSDVEPPVEKVLLDELIISDVPAMSEEDSKDVAEEKPEAAAIDSAENVPVPGAIEKETE